MKKLITTLTAVLLLTAASASAQTTPPMPPAQPTPTAVPTDVTPRHDGVWFNLGAGYGTLGCNDCDGRESGFSGGLSVGATINDRFLLGVGTAGWTKSYDGDRLNVGLLDARIRFYPSHTNGFFLTGGVGMGTLSFAGETEVGFGVILGLGYDIKIAKNASITPYWTGFAMSSSNADANVGQLGIGFTIH